MTTCCLVLWYGMEWKQHWADTRSIERISCSLNIRLIFQETLKFDLNIARLIQLLGDFVPAQIPYRGFAPGPHWGTSVPHIP